jgi:hypothetical protein
VARISRFLLRPFFSQSSDDVIQQQLSVGKNYQTIVLFFRMAAGPACLKITMDTKIKVIILLKGMLNASYTCQKKYQTSA